MQLKPPAISFIVADCIAKSRRCDSAAATTNLAADFEVQP